MGVCGGGGDNKSGKRVERWSLPSFPYSRSSTGSLVVATRRVVDNLNFAPSSAYHGLDRGVDRGHREIHGAWVHKLIIDQETVQVLRSKLDTT